MVNFDANFAAAARIQYDVHGGMTPLTPRFVQASSLEIPAAPVAVAALDLGQP